MKKHEIIELNGKEYTVELNRKSFLAIDKYINLQKTMEDINQGLYTYVDEIKEDDDPFADVPTIEDIEEEGAKKVKLMSKMIERAFWVWLYPKHKLSITEVGEIIKPYFDEDDEEKLTFIGEKYGEFLQMSHEIQEQYIEQQKKLNTLANKKTK